MPKAKPLPEDLLTKIKGLYDQEYGYKKIATLLGVSFCKVKKAYRILGLNGKRIRKSIYDNMTERSCKTCNMIKPIKDFIPRVNKDKVFYTTICISCYPTYVIGLKKKKNPSYVPFTEKQEKQKELLLNIEKLNAEGFSTHKITKFLKISRSVVKSHLKSLGIDISNRKNPRRIHLIKERICNNCPENGLQPVENFRKHKTKSGFSYCYCFVCERKINLARSKAKYEEIKNYPSVKLRRNVRSAISEALKAQGTKKNRKSCLKYLEFSISELRQHIENLFEPWMNWNNTGHYYPDKWDDNDSTTWRWQLDHIIPQSDLPYKSMEDENFKKCWALSNLRPLSAKQNLFDGVRRKRHLNSNYEKKIYDEIPLVPAPKFEYSQEFLTKIKELYDLGNTQNEIRKILYISQRQVRKSYVLLNIKKQAPFTVTDELTIKYKLLIEKDAKREEILKELNLTSWQYEVFRNKLQIKKTKTIDLTHKKCKECKETKVINEFERKEKISNLGNLWFDIDPYCKPCSSKLKKKRYYENNYVEYSRKRQNNSEHQEKRRKYLKNKHENDPVYKLSKRIRASIISALKHWENSKNQNAYLKILNYSIKDLKEHIEKQFEPWMNWNNRGNYNYKTWNDNDSSTWTWQIGHITSLFYLSFTSVDDENFKKYWALNNIRPLSAKKNALEKVVSNRKKI